MKRSTDVAQTEAAPFSLLLIVSVILASCATNSTGVPVAQAAPQPLTKQQAALQCWMGTEHGGKNLSLDKRAKVVDRCVKDKMDGHS